MLSRRLKSLITPYIADNYCVYMFDTWKIPKSGDVAARKTIFECIRYANGCENFVVYGHEPEEDDTVMLYRERVSGIFSFAGFSIVLYP
jgi:hypothetical protein